MPAAPPAARAAPSRDDPAAVKVWSAALTSGFPRRASGRVAGYRRFAATPLPPSLRPSVWASLLSALPPGAVPPPPGEARGGTPGGGREKRSYAALVAAGAAALDADATHTVEADVRRAVPGAAGYVAVRVGSAAATATGAAAPAAAAANGGAAPAAGAPAPTPLTQDALRRVLHAYAGHAPSVGYCQGMGDMAAVVLSQAPSEAAAAAMFRTLMDGYGFAELFAPGFPAIGRWLGDVDTATRAGAGGSALLDGLAAEGVPLEMVADKWLLSGLTYTWPPPVVLRVWDAVLLRGTPKPLTRAAAAALLLAAPRLTGRPFEEAVGYLQRGIVVPASGGVVTDDPPAVAALLKTAGGLKWKRAAVPGAPPRRGGCLACGVGGGAGDVP
ncbi:hypothetical protein BU14_0513s0011 [Porphyra umbilicalis]|uniref:Rab-GAP TBC domain-containing protein n=1 Tax=Porphyra umbilicalis TaxID=2786 RepID=A0A1X6NSW3_PORUM|nr:hypothetical protein BU14_0513s0011 [Porphyra umbilicalis]|eukprot:OSX71667.1 hypothetical protein BU14_0513s0011 [Porphyra umbilicalis]